MFFIFLVCPTYVFLGFSYVRALHGFVVPTATTFTAGANIQLDATNRVQVQDTPFRLASFTNATRSSNIPSPANGDLIYNSTEHKVQAYLSPSRV